MRILDRYIFKNLVKIFLGSLIFFIFLYIIVDVLSNLDETLEQKVSFLLLKDYYISFLPIIFAQIAPVSMLLGTIYTLGMLNRSNEIIAMRSSGLNIWQITKSFFIFALIISCLIFLVNEKLLPESYSSMAKIKELMWANSKKTKEEIIKNLTVYGRKNRLFFIDTFYLKSNILEGITILEHDEHQNLIAKIVAQNGIWEGNFWRFYNCLIYNFDPQGIIETQPLYYEEEIMDIPEGPLDFLQQMQKPEFMNISQLNNYVKKLSKSKAKGALKNFKVDLYQKFASPFSSLVIILAGIPFALAIKKRGALLSSFGISMIIGFLYYVVNSLSIAFGKAGILSPLLSAGLSPILFTALGFTMIKRLR